MTDILNLPHLYALAVRDNGDHYRIEAAGNIEPTACPACPSPPEGTSGLYRYGSRSQAYMDTPIHGKRVLLEIDRKRFRCKTCGKTFFEPLPDIDAKRHTTERLIRHIEHHCLRKTFAELSREVGVDDKTIRHIFDDYVTRLKATVHFEPPEVMGIDELKIVGQYRAMITNIERLSLYDMLPSRNKADLLAYFKKMPGKEKVKVLTMDMWNVYRQVAQAQFPGRMVVADRFHVVRMASDALERVRKAIRKGLKTKDRLRLKDDRFILLTRRDDLDEAGREKVAEWSAAFPVLGAAYKAKEAFHDIYSYRTKADAMQAAEAWEAELSQDVEWAFRETKGALRSWWTEIFNHYDRPISNAYTESINNFAKGMNRMGRGYSFEVIRARLLYDDKARRPTQDVIRKKGGTLSGQSRMAFVASSSPMTADPPGDVMVVEYGPHIPTLFRLLEAGHFD